MKRLLFAFTLLLGCPTAQDDGIVHARVTGTWSNITTPALMPAGTRCFSFHDANATITGIHCTTPQVNPCVNQ